MRPAAFDYRAPATLGEALALLAAHPGAKLLAGGQSLVPVLNLRLAAPPLLVDLRRIPELARSVLEHDGALTLGAMTRHRVFERDARVRAAQPLAAAAVPHIAHVAIRNRGTIGGSLCHADPAAEWPAVTLACDAAMTIAGSAGTRTVDAADFFTGLFETAVGTGEILTAVRFPAWPARRRHGFAEVARRHGDFALVGVAAAVDLDERGAVALARIAVFGAADAPVLAQEAAQALVGRRGEGAAREAGRLARARIAPRSDHHASAEYRSELVEVLVRRALGQALGVAPAKAA
ncbi:MAG: xanthine dehydrogenase family protein subunit M [Burkholderiales bacterium]